MFRALRNAATMGMIIAWALLGITLLFCSVTDAAKGSERDELKSRTRLLTQFAFRGIPPTCRTSRYIYVHDVPFGQYSNHIIEFTHGLWLAKKLNATLVIPEFMETSLKPFDTTRLGLYYCYIPKAMVGENATMPKQPLRVKPVQLFDLRKLFVQPRFKSLLPNLDHRIVDEVSYHFLKVYAGLWCCVDHQVVAAADWLIRNRLHNSLNYTCVHKRQLDGQCNRYISYELLTAINLQNVYRAGSFYLRGVRLPDALARSFLQHLQIMIILTAHIRTMQLSIIFMF